MFITFEGGEGAGKSTLIDSVYQHLQKQGQKVVKTRAPGGTVTGHLIREMLLHKESLSPRAELLLFLADRAQHVEEIILPALKEGSVVLCDRFNDSTLAYQGGARGFDKEWVKKLCAFATQNLQPDLTLYLDLDPAEGLRRVDHRTKDRIEAETLEFHQKIRTAYLEIAQKEPKRFHVLNASQSPKDVFAQALPFLSFTRESAGKGHFTSPS